ncbi:lipopolysaccharide biosynthesis protein [Demequina soli]|uniref:lipopolysaccharide biosynthesis protein n=1 Tax=Demequina soli TaxID=1638987 RepID=UPI00078235C3|nr:oligosaccharide flippase family protein [Demequina soli]
MAERRALHHQALLVAGSTAVAQLLMAVIYALAARVSGPEAFGRTATAITVAMSVAGLVDFGTNALWIRDLANKSARFPDVARRYAWKAIATGAAGALGFLALGAAGEPLSWKVSAFLGIAIVLNQATAVFLIADHRSERVAVALIVERLAGAAAFGLAFAVHASVEWALPLALLLGSMASIVTLWLATPAHLRPRPAHVGRPTNPWRGSLGFAAANAATSLATFDTAVIQATAGPAAAGSYAAVNRWTQPMGLLSTAVSTTAAPFLASAATTRDAIAALRKASWLLGLASAGGVAIAIAAPWIVPLILGSEFSASVGALQLLALGTTISVWNQPAAVLLQARNRDKTVAVIRLAASVAFLGAVAYLAPRWGATGAAVAFVLLQVSVAASFVVVGASELRRRRVAPAPEEVAQPATEGGAPL